MSMMAMVQTALLNRRAPGDRTASALAASTTWYSTAASPDVRSRARAMNAALWSNATTCAACGVQDRVPGTDIQEAFGGRLDQQRLEIVAVTDPVVPPAGVHVPQPTILLGVFGKLPLLTLASHCSRPTLFLN